LRGKAKNPRIRIIVDTIDYASLAEYRRNILQPIAMLPRKLMHNYLIVFDTDSLGSRVFNKQEIHLWQRTHGQLDDTLLFLWNFDTGVDCMIRIASYNSSYVDDMAQWTIKRVPVDELALVKENDATFCCTLG